MDSGTPAFEVQFANPNQPVTRVVSLPGASAEVAVESVGASDERVARLVFPGHPEYTASDHAGVSYRTELSLPQTFGYGVYRSRASFGLCTPPEQVVQALLGYFSDGSDRNGNGITDEVEIDVQVLCGDPSLVYLTVFTDYENDGASGERFRKLSRVIDFAGGRYYETPSDNRDGFVELGVNESWAIANLLRANAFYEVGFEWHAGSLRFFLNPGDGERTLWSLTDQAHVPRPPVQMIYNLWHPESFWYPRDGKAQYPAQDVTMLVDWFRYDSE